MTANLHMFALASSVVGAGAVMAWRVREARTPVTLPKIIAPPLGMSTGFCMFFFPPCQIPLTWALLAIALGAIVLSYPMVATSRLSIEGEHIMMQRSRVFLVVLLGLVAVRLAAREYFEQFLSTPQTGGLFFCLAFGMVARWRLGMLMQYRRLQAELAAR